MECPGQRDLLVLRSVMLALTDQPWINSSPPRTSHQLKPAVHELTKCQNIASLSTAAILASYIVSISCITLKRIRGEPLLPSKFNLGRAGLPINIASIVFLSFVFVFSFMPMGPRPTAAGMNWSILMFGSTIIFSILYYLVRGRHVYAGPVAYVRKSV